MKDDDAKPETKASKTRPVATVPPTTVFAMDLPAMPTLQLAPVDKKLVEKIVERMKEL